MLLRLASSLTDAQRSVARKCLDRRSTRPLIMPGSRVRVPPLLPAGQRLTGCWLVSFLGALTEHSENL